jgi:hypothetical protein
MNIKNENYKANSRKKTPGTKLTAAKNTYSLKKNFKK